MNIKITSNQILELKKKTLAPVKICLEILKKNHGDIKLAEKEI